MQGMTSPIDRSPFDRTIAVWNHKGGTFKTSVVANLGYLFAAGGNKVLMVDMDPKPTSTSTSVSLLGNANEA